MPILPYDSHKDEKIMKILKEIYGTPNTAQRKYSSFSFREEHIARIFYSNGFFKALKEMFPKEFCRIMGIKEGTSRYNKIISKSVEGKLLGKITLMEVE